MIKNIFHYKKNITKTKIAILGFGDSGMAAAKLGQYLGAKIFISDKQTNKNYELDQFEHELGGHTNKCLESDIIIKSPGINPKNRIIKAIQKKEIPIIIELRLIRL